MIKIFLKVFDQFYLRWMNSTKLFYYLLLVHILLLYQKRGMGESIGIGLPASLTSKGPQVKTTEPMDSIKVTYCSIQLG